MRKVIVQKWERVEGQQQYQKVDRCEALFHQWGVDYEEFDNGTDTCAGNFSAAIVEHADGQVENVPADLIRFISGEI